MKLGCNDSLPLRFLLEQGEVALDFLKVGRLDELEEDVNAALAYRPALIHVGFGVGDSAASYAKFDWNGFNALVRRSGSPHVAMHLEASTYNWRGNDLRVQSRAEVLQITEHLTSLCRLLQDKLECPLLLENMDYMGSELKPGYGVFRTSVEPALLWHLVQTEGVGVLLDLAHLRVTAYHLGLDVYAFARSLPLGKVREIHVSGPAHVPGLGLRDDHQELSEADYALLGWVLPRTNAEIVTLEYPKARTVKGGFDEQVAALGRQLTELRALVSAY